MPSRKSACAWMGYLSPSNWPQLVSSCCPLRPCSNVWNIDLKCYQRCTGSACAPADAAQHPPVELRPLERRGETPLSATLRLCGWLHAGGSRHGRVGRGGISAGQELTATDGAGGGATPADVGDDPRVWAGMPAGMWGTRTCATSTCVLLSSHSGRGEQTSLQCGGRDVVRAAGAGV